MHNPVFSPDLQIKQIKAWNCCSCWKTAFNLLDQKSVCSIWRLPLIIILAEIHIFMAKLELTSWSNKISWQSIAISRICSCHKWCNTIVPWSANSPACPDTFLSLPGDRVWQELLSSFADTKPCHQMSAPALDSSGTSKGLRGAHCPPVLKSSVTLGLCQPWAPPGLSRLQPQNYRIIEKPGLEGILKIIYFELPCHGQRGPWLGQLSQGLIQPDLEQFQGCGIVHPSERLLHLPKLLCSKSLPEA